MIKDGFYWCDKGHKLQQITERSTHIGTFYCRHCDKQYKVCVVNGVDCLELKNAMNKIKSVINTSNEELKEIKKQAVNEIIFDNK